MLTTIILYTLTFMIAGFSVYIKLNWLDKNLFSLSPEHLINNIFFWLMFGVFSLVILYRLLKDSKLVFELIRATKELKEMNSDNLDEYYTEFSEKFSDETRYKNLSYYWKAFKNSLFITKDGKCYQAIDAGEFYNKENLLQDKMNFRLMNYISQLLVGLGMLGTFLGLSIGLANLNLGTDDMKQLITLISGTKTAFYTSLYGMYFSISISMIFNIYFGFYEEKILILQNRINSIFKRYLKDEIIEEIKNEIILVRENTHELSINVGKELVKGVQEYNKSNREHLHNLTELVSTNISGLADNVSSAFEEKLEKIFSNEFIEPFITLKDKLLELSQHNNEEVGKYANLVSNVSENLLKVKNAIESFNEITLSNFDSIMNRVENKYEEISEVVEESKEIYIKYSELLNNSRDIIVSSNQYLEELTKVSNIFTSFTNQEEKLVEFWSNNKDIMTNLINTLEQTKIEELERVENYQKIVLGKLDEYYNEFNMKSSEQEEKMANYYKKHLEELFVEYDNSMGKAIILFKNILGELEEKLYKIEDTLKYSNKVIDEERVLIEEKYKISQENYLEEMDRTSIEYKKMLESLMELSKNIRENLIETNKIVKEKNNELQTLKEETSIKELVEINNNIFKRIEELNSRLTTQLENHNSTLVEEKEVLKSSYKELMNILEIINNTQDKFDKKLELESIDLKESQERLINTLSNLLLKNDLKPYRGNKYSMKR